MKRTALLAAVALGGVVVGVGLSVGVFLVSEAAFVDEEPLELIQTREDRPASGDREESESREGRDSTPATPSPSPSPNDDRDDDSSGPGPGDESEDQDDSSSPGPGDESGDQDDSSGPGSDGDRNEDSSGEGASRAPAETTGPRPARTTTNAGLPPDRGLTSGFRPIED